MNHAMRCMEITESHRSEMEDFDLAFAYEGLARAHALAGNLAEARKNFDLASQLGAVIADDEDRQIFMDNLKAGKWFGVV